MPQSVRRKLLSRDIEEGTEQGIWGIQDEPRLSAQRPGRERWARAEDVFSKMGPGEGQLLLSRIEEARQGFEVRRMKKMIPVRGLNPALGRMIRRMK